MFDSLLGSKFSKKCKYCVKCINSRVVLIRKKKLATIKFLKKDVADLLANGHDSNAFGRIDALIVEINHASCYDMIEKYCQCILNQLPILQKQRECPEEATEAVSTLIFAAARFSDLPELYDLRRLFTERYGSHMESYVNAEFVEKMQKRSFSTDRKLRLMQDIAEEFSVGWDSKAFRQKASTPPAPSSNQAKRSISNKEQRSHAQMNQMGTTAAVSQHTEAVFDVAREANRPNRAVVSTSVSASRRNEAKFNADVAMKDRNKEVVIEGGSFLGRKEVVLNADVTTNGRKEPDINRREPPTSFLQDKRVQPELRDIHVVPSIPDGRQSYDRAGRRKTHAAAEEQKNVEPSYGSADRHPFVQPKLIHEGERAKEATARNRSPMAQEGPGLIGLEKLSAMPASYNKLKGARNVADVVDGSPVFDEFLKADKVPDPSVPVKSKDARPMSMIPPPYTKPNFRNSSILAEEAKLTDVRISGFSPPDYERFNEGKARPVSVRRRHQKPPQVIENDDSMDDAKPSSKTPNGLSKDERLISDNVHRHQGKTVVEEIHGAVNRERHGQRKHDDMRSVAIYDGDCDEEEVAMDRLLVHYSKKSIDVDPRKMRTRMVASAAEPVIDAGRPAEHHDNHGHNGNGRSHRSTAYRPERVASLRPEPATPIVEVKVSKGPARAASMHPDLPSLNVGRLYPRTPEYDDLTARFIALKNS